MPQPSLSQSTVKALLYYSPQTGKFRWKERPDNQQWSVRYAGKEAGYFWKPNPEKLLEYVIIRIFDWPFAAHRVAFLYMTGRWPKADVDHKDGTGTNNRWNNLREATKSQNGMNRGAQQNSKTGIKGVCKDGNRFRATINISRRQISLGSYSTSSAAALAYERAARRLHGQFSKASQ